VILREKNQYIRLFLKFQVFLAMLLLEVKFELIFDIQTVHVTADLDQNYPL
jgi:hypothetical protein